MSYLKKLMKNVWFWFWFFLAMPFFIELFINWIGGNLEPYSLLRYLNKILLVVKVNISYFASIVAIGLSYKKFLSDKKDQEERKNKLEEQILLENKKSNQLRKEELENYLDQYRPAFVRKDDNLILVMKKENLYLKNVVYFSSPESQFGVNRDDLKHGETIILNGIINNYFISGETLLGEKIIFGNILNNIGIYKVLKMGCKLIEPKIDYDIEKIDESLDNWRSYNTGSMQITETDANDEMISFKKNIDRIFMNMTQYVRRKIWIDSSFKQLNETKIDSLPDLFKETIDQIESKIRDKYKRDVLVMVLGSILYENKLGIKIDLNNIEENDREALIYENLSEKNDEISAYELFECIKINNSNAYSIANKLKILIKYLKIDESVNDLLLEYKNLIAIIIDE